MPIHRRDEYVVSIMRDLTDLEPCRYGHHGGCQSHGYLTLEPGQLCPHLEAKKFLENYKERD